MRAASGRRRTTGLRRHDERRTVRRPGRPSAEIATVLSTGAVRRYRLRRGPPVARCGVRGRPARHGGTGGARQRTAPVASEAHAEARTGREGRRADGSGADDRRRGHRRTGDTLARAARTMRERGLSWPPVVDTDGRIAGCSADRPAIGLHATTAIRAEIIDGVLLKTMLIDPARIDVDVADGVVTMTGRLDTPQGRGAGRPPRGERGRRRGRRQPVELTHRQLIGVVAWAVSAVTAGGAGPRVKLTAVGVVENGVMASDQASSWTADLAATVRTAARHDRRLWPSGQ